MEKYVNHEKCIAIGECGLDYFRLDEKNKNETIKLQKEVFISQINFAKKVQKPLIVHIRQANDDARNILVNYGAKDIGGVLHCYNASDELLCLSSHNFYFGIGGVVTFKNAQELVNQIPNIPKNRLLLETDSPYLTPVPFRGKRNQPLYTNYVAQKIADILNISKNEVENITTKNALRLFKEFNRVI
jgi:TatD DNase family protein